MTPLSQAVIQPSANAVHAWRGVRSACTHLAWFCCAACGPTIPPPVAESTPPAATHAPEPAPPEATANEVSAGAPRGAGARTSACGGTPAENVTSGGTPSASDPGERAEEGPQALFDDHTGTKWSESANPTPWLAYDLPAGVARVVEQYALSPVPEGPPARDPVSWRLEGSNDDGPTATWTTLHAEQAQHFVSRQATMWYAFENTRPFRRYRFVITENGGGPGVQLAELGLYGEGSPQFSVDDAVRGKGIDQFQYSPGWEGHGTGDAEFHPPKYGHSSSWSKRKDEFASFTFEGSRIEVFGVRFPGHGIAAFSVDGAPEVTSDFYGENSGNVLFYTSDPLCPPGRHVLRIRPTGDKNPKSVDTFVSIDRVRVTP